MELARQTKNWLAGAVLLAAWSCTTSGAASPAAGVNEVAPGALMRIGPANEPAAFCPLEHTDVRAAISGFLARVTVTQQFRNDSPEAVEAVYVFPLSQRAAVDGMTMRVGDRTVKGTIKEREEARAIYEAAKARGHLASLLDQERPNIFTQAVANIPPGAKVQVEITYVETLPYEDGTYEFSFPMVVGPRYIPGQGAGRSGGGWASDTNEVPDASKITPPVARPGTRAGHDISVAVSLDAGVPVRRVLSKTNEIDVEERGRGRAEIRRRAKNTKPNKDFVLSYDVAGAGIADAVLTHHDARGGFFTLVLQPPARVSAEDVTPKEMVFVLDTSGSMSGMPIEKAKEVIQLAIDGLYPRDTFNLITFAGDTRLLFPAPVPATPENVRLAKEFVSGRYGGGGTEMMKAIRAALDPSDRQEHLRIVCFLTDGYVGNDMAIVDEIQKHPNARVFSFGIGSSVNRFLLDKMAEVSRGEVEYVTLKDDGSAAARRFHERVRNPLLTDVAIDWGGLPVSEVYPKRIPDLFSAKPVVVAGRYQGPARGIVGLQGRMSGQPFTRSISIDLPSEASRHDVLATLWARRKVDALMAEDWTGVQNRSPKPEVRRAITDLGLEFKLVTQFTSFVAVEESIVTEGGRPRRVEVPVEMPEGVSYEGVFGGNEMVRTMAKSGFAGVPAGAHRTMIAQEAAPGPGPSAPASRDEAKAAEEQDLRKRRDNPAAKLHPDLVRLAEGGVAAGLTVRAGLVLVDVWLEDAAPETLARLRALGFRPEGNVKVAKIRAGWLPVAKLREAAALAGVRFVTPHRG